MSRSKMQKLYLLLGLLFVCCAATFAVSRYEEHKETIKNSDAIILSLDADAVTAVAWEYDGTKLSFHKDDTWTYDEDAAFPVDAEKLAELLGVFGEFGAAFEITDVTDESQYGLDAPVCTITLSVKDTEEMEFAADEGADDKKSEDGSSEESAVCEYKIKLGDYSAMDEQRYVLIEKDGASGGIVYLAAHDPFADYELTLDDLLDDDQTPDFSEAAVASIMFSGAEAYEIGYEEDSDNTYCAEDVYFADGKPLDTAKVDSYLSTISHLDLSESVSYNVTDEELETYGLDTPELTATVTYTPETEDDRENEQETFTIHIGRNQKELKKAQKSKKEDAESEVSAYARIGDSQIVYKITTTTYETLAAASYDDLRHSEVLTASLDDVNQLTVLLEGESYTFTSKQKKKETLWYFADEETDLSSLQSALETLAADSFTVDEPDGKEEIALTVTLNDNAETEIQMAFYRVDGEQCLAVVDGEPFAYVPRSQVVELIEAVHGIVLAADAEELKN